MEFLLTYGWAIMIVVIGISAMSYFGVFNAVGMAFQPNRCVLEVGLTCVDHRIEYAPGAFGSFKNHLYLIVKNNRGDNLRISRVTILDEYGQSQPWEDPELALPNDEEVTIVLQDITVGNPAMPSGTRCREAPKPSHP
jgi:hypothetical protein